MLPLHLLGTDATRDDPVGGANSRVREAGQQQSAQSKPQPDARQQQRLDLLLIRIPSMRGAFLVRSRKSSVGTSAIRYTSPTTCSLAYPEKVEALSRRALLRSAGGAAGALTLAQVVQAQTAPAQPSA